MKMRMTFVVTLVLLLGAGLSWWVSVYQRQAALDAKLPKANLGKILKDLRAYHKAKGKFPESFEDVQREVWKLERAPRMGDKGHSFTMRNYYYLLTQITPHAATVWAAPINERFREGNTYFLVVFHDREELWKGAALEPHEFATLPANPTEYQLATMGLTKQPTKDKQPQAPKTSSAKF
jgi:hypothetical protein